MSFSVRAALTVDDRVLRLQTPASFWWKRGAVLAVGVPVLLTILVALVALLDTIEVGEPSGLTLIAAAGSALLGGICMLVGGVHVLRAGPKSRASLVEIDLDQGIITSAAEGTHPLSAVRGLELHQPNPVLKWHAITARLHAGPQAEDGDPYRPPASGSVQLLGQINELELGAARELMETVAGHLGGLPAADKSSSLLGGGGSTGEKLGRLGHALAYVPVQGIFLIASIVLLVARRKDPVAQFHARQSLAFLPFELAALFGGILVTVPFMFIGDEPHPAAAVLMGLVLLPIALGRLGLRFYAAWKAHKGACWVIPGMGWLSRRWLPPVSDET